MEEYKPKVGDRVRIKRGSQWNSAGKMDLFIGREVTITHIKGGRFIFNGDDEGHPKSETDGRWVFYSDSFEPISNVINLFKFC